MKPKIFLLVVSCVLLTMTCKTAKRIENASNLRSTEAIDVSNIAIILVHGWGKTPRRPLFIWRLKIKPYTDLTNLRDRFLQHGFSSVSLVEYDDEDNTSNMAKTVADQIQNIFEKANNPDLRFDIVAHSLGQFVSLKAILEHPIALGSSEKIISRVRLFVGLAGAARGQDVIRPCRIFPNQCGGAETLTPYYRKVGEGAIELQQLFETNRDAIDKLKKCSLYARSDEIVDSPYNAGSFNNLGFDPANIKDMEIEYDGAKFHKDVKDHPDIINKMFTGCYEILM
jgi:pimeloyl-ACP methyl ester carboxylesterase